MISNYHFGKSNALFLLNFKTQSASNILLRQRNSDLQSRSRIRNREGITDLGNIPVLFKI